MFSYCPIHRDDCLGNDCMWWRNDDCIMATMGESLLNISTSLEDIDAKLEEIITDQGLWIKINGAIKTI